MVIHPRKRHRLALLGLVLLWGCSADDADDDETAADDSAAASTDSGSIAESSEAESSTGVSPADVCFACAGPLFQPGGECEAAIGACVMDAECDAWNTCYEGCFVTDPVPTCFAGCKEDHPDAMPLYDAVVACVCGACSTECDPACQ